MEIRLQAVEQKRPSRDKVITACRSLLADLAAGRKSVGLSIAGIFTLGTADLVADVYFAYMQLDPLAHPVIKKLAAEFISLVDNSIRELETSSQPTHSPFDGSQPVLTESIQL